METLIAGAAAALIGVFAGRKLGSSRDLEVFSGRVGAIERLLQENGISASLPDTLEQRLQVSVEARAKTVATEAANSVRELVDQSMERQGNELLKTLDDKLDGLMTTLRDEQLHLLRQERQAIQEEMGAAMAEGTKDLISRSEVQEAFARVAQIEAQRINSERQAQEAAARQQAMRAQAVFGAPAMPPEMNTAINNQLAALNERLQQIGASMPVA